MIRAAAWRTALPVLAAVGLILLLPPAAARPAAAADVPLIDAHSQLAALTPAADALAAMDRAGISRTILSALGGRDKVREVVALAQRHPDRLTPSIDLKNRRFRESEPSGLRSIRQQADQPAFGAMSELMVWHVQKGARAPEIDIDFDAPSVRLALEVALQRRWPLVIHIEFGSAGSRFDKYMQGLERLLALHPDHPMVLSHMGQLTSEQATHLITAHQNIYFLTSKANPEIIDSIKQGEPWTNLFSGGVLASDWKALFVAHSDRFILAFDNVYVDDWGHKYLRQVVLWRSALRDLPEAVAHAVGHGNAERLWRLPPPGMAGRPPAQPGPAMAARAASPPDNVATSVGDIDRRSRRFNTLEVSRKDARHPGEVPTRTGSGVPAAPLAAGPAALPPAILPDAAKQRLDRLIASGFQAETTVDGRRRPEPHNAADLRGQVGDDVLAAADGKVVFAGDTPRGLRVTIGHGKDAEGFWLFSSYVHNAENLVKAGDGVTRGQVIARLGDSGSKRVPHLHFQVDRSPEQHWTRGPPTRPADPLAYWHVPAICFDAAQTYVNRPVRFTLPLRCAN